MNSPIVRRINKAVNEQSNQSNEGVPKMNTILNVTPDGLSNLEIDRLKSEVAKKAIYRTAIFSTTQNLINSAGKMQKFQTYMLRLPEEQQKNILTSNRYIDSLNRASQSAVKLACLDALQEAKGYALDVILEPRPQRLSTSSQLQEKAKFADMTIEEVTKVELNNQNKMLQQASEGINLATSLFYSADIEEYQPEYDSDGNQLYESYDDNDEQADFNRPIQSCSTRLVYFHPESVLKDLTRTRDFLLTWAQTDYAEIGLIVQDIKSIEKACQKFTEITEYASENSREMDNMAATNEDLNQAAA